MKRKLRRRIAASLSLGIPVAAALTFATCSSIPRIVPDLARPKHAIRLEGSRGPLSAARSREILGRLGAEGREPDLLKRHLAFEEAISDSPLMAGNSVRLLQDGPETYDAMLSAIRSARDHVNLETYILEDDEIGRRFSELLVEKQHQCVQVNLIHDAVGTLDTPEEFLRRLSEAGIAVLEFNPINPLAATADWSVNQRDHRKLLIVDGRVVLLGGINISGVYSRGSSPHRSAPRPDGKKPWRDTDLEIRGPAVAEFQKMFLETWNRQKGPPLSSAEFFPQLRREGEEVVHALGSSPGEEFNLIYGTLLSAIDSAQREILLTNAYFVPDPALVDALKAAAARGVDVRLVLPGSSDSRLVLAAGRSHYDDLLAAGVKIFERQVALMHAKTAVIDGVWSTVGSTNLDWRSLLHNQEVNAVVLGPTFGRRMQAAFADDVAASAEVTLTRWRARRWRERAVESFARLWEYWL